MPKIHKDAFSAFNVADGAIARNVTVDAPPAQFTFLEGTYWPEIAGRTFKSFKGRPTSTARLSGIDFTITWFDEHGDKWEALAVVESQDLGSIF